MNAKYTVKPWEFSGHDDCLANDNEVTGLVDASGDDVLSIGWGGFACESDPYGAYPILEASDENWAIIKAAPKLLAALQAIVKQPQGHTVADAERDLAAVCRIASAAIEQCQPIPADSGRSAVGLPGGLG